MPLTETTGEQRVLLRSVRWETYVALCDETEQAGRRMTYDRGRLEIMTPSMPHEAAGALLGRMIETFTLERDIEIRSVASTTFRRSDLERGFEADEAYYIAHAAAIRTLREVELGVHPPPDLVVEVEITRSAIDKLPLLAAIGVPEVWCYDGQSLWIGTLRGDSYEQSDQSHVLAGFPVKLAEALLAQQFTTSETALIRRFAESLKECR